MKETDERIIGHILGGNQQAFTVLVDRYKDRVFSLVLKILRDRELAEEVAQDVFVKAYSSMQKFRKEAAFSTWIYRIAYNTAISETRRKKLKSVAFETTHENKLSLALENDIGKELKEAKYKLLEKAFEELRPDDHLLMTLYYLDERSVDDISKTMDMSLSNVKVKLFRIRKKLQEIVQKSGNVSLAFYEIYGHEE